MKLTRIVGSYLEKIFDRYDPENDGHGVTWAEANLAYAVSDLTNAVIELTNRIETLERKARNEG